MTAVPYIIFSLTDAIEFLGWEGEETNDSYGQKALRHLATLRNQVCEALYLQGWSPENMDGNKNIKLTNTLISILQIKIVTWVLRNRNFSHYTDLYPT